MLNKSAHWITNDWKLFLIFVTSKGSHSENNITSKFYEILKKFGSLKKINTCYLIIIVLRKITKENTFILLDKYAAVKIIIRNYQNYHIFYLGSITKAEKYLS